MDSRKSTEDEITAMDGGNAMPDAPDKKSVSVGVVKTLHSVILHTSSGTAGKL